MRYARIENNVVVEIIDFNPDGCFVEEIVKQFVVIKDGIDVEQNYNYIDGIFYKPLNDDVILNSLIPTDDEQRQADFEIRTINLLIEMGLL